MAVFSDVSLERGLPASVEAERSILGAILLDNHSYNEAAEKLAQKTSLSIPTAASIAGWRS